MTEARQWGEATARDLALYKQGKLAWKDIDPGGLLFGAPGTGKTTYAKALAATCRVPLVATSFSEWQSADGGHLGSTMAAMKAAFATAAIEPQGPARPRGGAQVSLERCEHVGMLGQNRDDRRAFLGEIILRRHDVSIATLH